VGVGGRCATEAVRVATRWLQQKTGAMCWQAAQGRRLGRDAYGQGWRAGCGASGENRYRLQRVKLDRTSGSEWRDGRGSAESR
jgi:hypothetical protein